MGGCAHAQFKCEKVAFESGNIKNLSIANSCLQIAVSTNVIPLDKQRTNKCSYSVRSCIPVL